MCIRSSDFTLNFKTVVERATFDQLQREYKKCERELAYTYLKINARIEKDILFKKYLEKFKFKVDGVNFETMKCTLETQVDEKIQLLDGQMKETLEQPGRSKWKDEFETLWAKFKSAEKQRWIDQLRTFFECQLNYDIHVENFKTQMRLRIREMFTSNSNSSKQSNAVQKEKQDFNQLYDGFLKKAIKDYPPIQVNERVDLVYINNTSIKALQINLLNHETISKVMKDLKYVYDTDENLSYGMVTHLDDDKNYWQKFEESVLAVERFKVFPSLKNAKEDRRQKMKDDILAAIVNCVQYEQVYMDPIVDKVIAITEDIIKKYTWQQHEIEHAHILAKHFVTSCLEIRQSNWESENSVSAKLAQASTKKEMEAYFNAVSRGIVDTELLVNTLTANFLNILPEAFNREIIRTIDSRTRTKSWLSDPKAMQAHLDLGLLKLIDQNKVDEMLEKVRNSATFYEQVLTELIAIEISRVNVKKESRSFIAKFKEAINAAVVAALSIRKGRAKKFIDELHSQCLEKFEGTFLAINLITDSSGYEGCDIEEENVFREKCLQLFERSTTALNSFNFNNKWRFKLSRQVLIYMRDLRREDVARPRCKVTCPQCGSLCIHPAGHQTLVVKHDTYHQPGGITGVCWRSEIKNKLSGTLCQETCSMQLEKIGSISLPNGEKRKSKDFSKEFPKWMPPKLTDRLPLREYILANYKEEIAKKYKCKPCVNIPEDYYHDIEAIRLDLQRAAKLSQDHHNKYVSCFIIYTFKK